MRTFCLFPILALQVLAAEAVVEFSQLSTTRLPYNQRVAIRGSTADFKSVTGLMTIQNVSVSYSACKTGSMQAEGPAAEVTGDSWTVLAGPFEEGEKICFRFRASGKLTPTAAENAANKLLSSATYRDEVNAFLVRAEDQKPDIVEALARGLVDRLGTEIAASLPAKLKKDTQRSFATALASGMYRSTALINLGTRRKNLIDSKVPGVTATMTLSEIYAHIQTLTDAQFRTITPPALIDGAIEVADDFRKDYDRVVVRGLVQIPLQENLDVSVDQIASAEVKYLEKYAAVDLASIWIPRIQEFRGFAVLNVYLGPVELNPAPARALGQMKQRTSLLLGYSLANLSSSHPTKIRGNNVWIYGIGFRLNRYFRVSAGGALYRGADQQAGLRNDFFLGPSIDLTAIEYFKTVFSKIK
jgi:hypothetical protein